jgi:hypothetical protein
MSDADRAGCLLIVFRIYCRECNTAQFIESDGQFGAQLEAKQLGWQPLATGWNPWLCPACVAKHEGVRP